MPPHLLALRRPTIFSSFLAAACRHVGFRRRSFVHRLPLRALDNACQINIHMKGWRRPQRRSLSMAPQNDSPKLQQSRGPSMQPAPEPPTRGAVGWRHQRMPEIPGLGKSPAPAIWYQCGFASEADVDGFLCGEGRRRRPLFRRRRRRPSPWIGITVNRRRARRLPQRACTADEQVTAGGRGCSRQVGGGQSTQPEAHCPR